jgi:hypothetical protein
MIAGYSNCDTFPLTALGSLQTFALLPPVLNQSFTNGSNADKAPFLNYSIIQPATCLSSTLCANYCLPPRYRFSLIIEYTPLQEDEDGTAFKRDIRC